jgi:hypothetical protein
MPLVRHVKNKIIGDENNFELYFSQTKSKNGGAGVGVPSPAHLKY